MFWFFAFLGMCFIVYGQASALQGQNAFQERVERSLGEGRERDAAASELLQSQLDRLQEEISGNPIEDVEMRLVRVRRSIEFFGRAWGMRQAKQVAEMRLKVLDSIRNNQN